MRCVRKWRRGFSHFLKGSHRCGAAFPLHRCHPLPIQRLLHIVPSTVYKKPAQFMYSAQIRPNSGIEGNARCCAAAGIILARKLGWRRSFGRSSCSSAPVRRGACLLCCRPDQEWRPCAGESRQPRRLPGAKEAIVFVAASLLSTFNGRPTSQQVS